MKSPSKQKLGSINLSEQKINQAINRKLDESLEQLSDKKTADISLMRVDALKKANELSNKGQFNHSLENILGLFSWHKSMTLAAPMAAAIVLTILVIPPSSEPIPELPFALMSADIPSEDLALLENLEFLTWLANNEMDAVL